LLAVEATVGKDFYFFYFCIFILKKGIYAKKRNFHLGGGGRGGEGEMTNLIHQENSLGRMNG
jgi:hypothetical protein